MQECKAYLDMNLTPPWERVVTRCADFLPLCWRLLSDYVRALYTSFVLYRVGPIILSNYVRQGWPILCKTYAYFSNVSTDASYVGYSLQHYYFIPLVPYGKFGKAANKIPIYLTFLNEIYEFD